MSRISVAFPWVSNDWLLHIELHHWFSTTFLQGEEIFVTVNFRHLYMYQQYFTEIPVNLTCVLPQSASVDDTADMHYLLIDQNKNGKLATTISCYNGLSYKSWCFYRVDQLLPYLCYIGKYFEAGQSQPCNFELWA